jgi:hypothetical protein
LEIFIHIVVTIKAQAFCRCPDGSDYSLASAEFSFDYTSREVKPIGAGKKDKNTGTLIILGNDGK